jgi:hypothetical protein
LSTNLAQSKYRPLPFRQLCHSRGDLPAALGGQEPILGVRLWLHRFTRGDLVRGRRREHPAESSCARFPEVQTTINENPGEPYLKWQVLPVIRQMSKDLDEGILDGFVSVVRVSETVIRNTCGASLLQRHEIAEPVSCGITFACEQQGFDLCRQTRVF